MPAFKYLRRVPDVGWILDHRLAPEVRAGLCAMSSRMPEGGIEQRYLEIVRAIAEDMLKADIEKNPNPMFAEEFTYEERIEIRYELAEDRLCKYPLHPRFQAFFDKNVKEYGHSSPLELVGSPSVYIQGISPFTAYLSFDNPLVAGQEFSTRAVRRKDWPLCWEAYVSMSQYAHLVGPNFAQDTQYVANHGREGGWMPHLALQDFHTNWLEVFEAEVEAWRAELRRDCDNCEGSGYEPGPETSALPCGLCEGTGKAYPFIKDPQAFRPALDRARWAIPSTIATGFAHTANPRVMGRVIQDGKRFSHNSPVWQNIQKTFEESLPGMKGMWLREAVVEMPETVEEQVAYVEKMLKRSMRGTIGSLWDPDLPQHLRIGFVEPGPEVTLGLIWATSSLSEFVDRAKALPRRKDRGYLDPTWNQIARVTLEFQCSWAVARDWHRHRTAYPWHLNIVVESLDVGFEGGVPNIIEGIFQCHSAYQPLTDIGQQPEQWQKATELFKMFRDKGDMEKAMLCLPFGTLVSMRTSMGLRDAVYMLELRANAHGANFEYEAQAKEALRQMKVGLGPVLTSYVFPEES